MDLNRIQKLTNTNIERLLSENIYLIHNFDSERAVVECSTMTKDAILHIDFDEDKMNIFPYDITFGSSSKIKERTIPFSGDFRRRHWYKVMMSNKW